MEVSSPCEAILKKANENDYLIFAGGGIIERYIPNVIRYFKEDFSLLKVPYGVVGLGVGSFDYSQYKEELKFWIENAKFFYTRDEYTTQRLYDTCGELSNIS